MLKQRLEFDKGLRGLVEGPVTIATIDRVLFELQRLARIGSSPRSGLARVALDLIERKRFQVLETIFGLPDVDTSIVAFSAAQRGPVLVATVDRQLRRLLARHQISTIYPRGRRGMIVSRALTPVRLK